MRPLIGIDLVSTARLAEKLATDPDFWAVFLTPSEWEECRGAGRWLDRTAGRWAAKEAVVKVIRPRRLSFPLTEIGVSSGPGGVPQVELRGGAARAAEAAGLVDWDVSISHSAGFAMASAVAMTPPVSGHPSGTDQPQGRG